MKSLIGSLVVGLAFVFGLIVSDAYAGGCNVQQVQQVRVKRVVQHVAQPVVVQQQVVTQFVEVPHVQLVQVPVVQQQVQYVQAVQVQQVQQVEVQRVKVQQVKVVPQRQRSVSVQRIRTR